MCTIDCALNVVRINKVHSCVPNGFYLIHRGVHPEAHVCTGQGFE